MHLDLAVAAELPSTLLTTLPSAALAFADQADNAAGPLFAGSLVPYLIFLYFVCQDCNGLDRAAKVTRHALEHVINSSNAPDRVLPQAGFASLLAFVTATVVASIVAKTQYGTTLANVDWLHASAESLLTFTNIADVIGLKLTLDAAIRGDGPMLRQSLPAPAPAPASAPVPAPSGLPLGVGSGGGGGGVPLGVGFFGCFLAALAAGQAVGLGVHAPFLGGVGDLTAGAWGVGFSEPENALSLPTWVIHVSSLLEWLVAMGLVWRIGLVTGNPRWQGLTWAMIPSHASGVAACAYHVFYNAPDLQSVVLLQAALTFLGNATLALAAYRLAASNGWRPQLPFGEPAVASASASQQPDAAAPVATAAVAVDSSSGTVAAIAQLALVSVGLSYAIKYGGALLPLTREAPWWAAAGLIALPTALNANKWRERSAEGGDFDGFV